MCVRYPKIECKILRFQPFQVTHLRKTIAYSFRFDGINCKQRMLLSTILVGTVMVIILSLYNSKQFILR